MAALVSGKHGVGHAAEEQRNPRPFGPDRRQDLRKRRPAPESFGSMACMRRRVGGKSRVSPVRSAQSSTPSRCSQPRRRKRHRTRAGVRKQVVQDQPLEPARLLVTWAELARAILNGSIILPY